jgi:hypothetical protein
MPRSLKAFVSVVILVGAVMVALSAITLARGPVNGYFVVLALITIARRYKEVPALPAHPAVVISIAKPG